MLKLLFLPIIYLLKPFGALFRFLLGFTTGFSHGLLKRKW